MKQKLHIPGLQRLSFEDSPGIPGYLRRWWSSEEIPRPAMPPIHLQMPSPRAGSAWADPGYQEELRTQHRRMAAPASSRSNLEQLFEGAACVITGQQPAVLGGPLYCAWKIAGAVGLARALSERWGHKVVPVYWCGGDDSDFAEASSIWVQAADDRPWQARLQGDLMEPGSMVGSLAGSSVQALEDSLCQLLGSKLNDALRGELDALEPRMDLGDRTAASFLRLFQEAGLVVVDGRSERLRQLGRPLLQRYVGQHRAVTEEVDARGKRLEASGFGLPLQPAATRSGLFAVRDSRRVKLDPAEFEQALRRGEDLSPSVLLRAPMQDALLAPVAAVLGPSELLYHAQLAPAYKLLGVQAAAPAPRPHLTLLPPACELPDSSDARQRLLAGGDAARQLLAEKAMPTGWKTATGRLRGEIDEALAGWRNSMGTVGEDRDLEQVLRRFDQNLDELYRRLLPHALELDPERNRQRELIPEWLAVRGVPQERAYAAWLGWQWLGPQYPGLLRSLGDVAAEDLLAGQAAIYCASISTGEA